LGLAGPQSIATLPLDRRFIRSTRPRSLTKTLKKALPEAQRIIKDAGGKYIAGGFNKAKVNYGKPEAGNRYVIIHFENEAAANKFWDGGGKDWVAKNAPNARNLIVEGVEQK
jgi:uncharacterized protein (DUF1330 family)